MRNLDAEAWVRTWKAAGPRLEAIRVEELRRVDVYEFVRSMGDAFESSALQPAPERTSGFVEQQRLFSRLPR